MNFCELMSQADSPAGLLAPLQKLVNCPDFIVCPENKCEKFQQAHN